MSKPEVPNLFQTRPWEKWASTCTWSSTCASRGCLHLCVKLQLYEWSMVCKCPPLCVRVQAPSTCVRSFICVRWGCVRCSHKWSCLRLRLPLTRPTTLDWAAKLERLRTAGLNLYSCKCLSLNRLGTDFLEENPAVWLLKLTLSFLIYSEGNGAAKYS